MTVDFAANAEADHLWPGSGWIKRDAGDGPAEGAAAGFEGGGEGFGAAGHRLNLRGSGFQDCQALAERCHLTHHFNLIVCAC